MTFPGCARDALRPWRDEVMQDAAEAIPLLDSIANFSALLQYLA